MDTASMQPATSSPNSPWVIVIAILLSVCGAAIYMVQPVYLGVLGDSLGLSGQQLGLLAGVETGGALVVSISAPWWSRYVSSRQAATLALVVLLIGNLACLFADSFNALLLLRAVISLLGAGLAYTLAFLLLASVENRERAYSLAVFSQVSVGAAGLAFIPALADEHGADVIFISIAGLTLLVATIAWRLPSSLLQPTGVQATGQRFSKRSMLLLAAQFLWYIGVGAVWAFIERIGRETGLAAEEVGNALSVGIIVSLLASLLAAWMSRRYGTGWQMPLMLLVHVALFAALLSGQVSALGFIVTMILFNFFWNFSLPYLMAAIAEAEPDARAAGLIPACQTGALMIGPVAAGMLVSAHSFANVLIFAISVYFLLGLLLLLTRSRT